MISDDCLRSDGFRELAQEVVDGIEVYEFVREVWSVLPERESAWKVGNQLKRLCSVSE